MKVNYKENSTSILIVHDLHCISDKLMVSKKGVDFMGMRVSWPQYLRLIVIQKEVIRMDQTIRAMLRTYNHRELAQNPYWIELLDLYNSLAKMLPEKYLKSVENQ